jgi:Tfp pilus assembly PilM family ATPase
LARFLAIDADAHGLFVATASVKGGKVVIEQAVALADEVPPLTATTAVAVGTRLKELLKTAGIKPAPVLACIGRDKLFPKLVTIPPTSPAEEPAVVRFQAIRELTESPDDVVMDYFPFGDPLPDGERQAAAVFARKDAVQAIKLVLDRAGLKPAAITPRPFGLSAALNRALARGSAPPPDDPAGAVAVVSLWDRGGEFVVHRGRELLFTRSVPAPAVASQQLLITEIRRNIAVFDGQTPATPVQAVYLAEPVDPGGGWSGPLRAALAVPVYSFDPLDGSAAADTVPAPYHGRFAGPVGLLAARAVSSTLPINYAAPRQPKAGPDRARSRVLIAALAITLVFAMAAAFALLTLDRAGRRVQELALTKSELDADLARYELDARRQAAADEFTGREVVVLDELYDYTDRVPDVSKATVTEFDLTAIAPKAAPKGQAAVAAKKDAKTAPVSSLRTTLRTADGKLAQDIADAFKNDTYYLGTLKTTSPAEAGRTPQYIITAQVVHRGPEKYHRHLRVAAPKRVGQPARGDDADVIEFGGFGGGFGQ